MEDDYNEQAKQASEWRDPRRLLHSQSPGIVPIRDAISANGGNPSAVPDGDISALTLASAECWPLSGGDGLRVPAIRVPFEAIDAWWLCRGEKLSGAGQSGGEQSFFGGVMLPIPLG